MGLDAVVYRNVANINLGEDRRSANVDPETGEVYFEEQETARKHQGKLLPAAESRLGNVAEISALSDEITRLLGPHSSVCDQVLYSGSHSGDMIPTSGLPALAAEIERLRRLGSASQALLLFLKKLETLIGAALTERNPIVFV
jgi:hypothetical protein